MSIDLKTAHKLYSFPLDPNSVSTKLPSADAVVLGIKQESSKKIRPFASPAATLLTLSRKTNSITSEESPTSNEYENKWRQYDALKNWEFIRSVSYKTLWLNILECMNVAIWVSNPDGTFNDANSS